MKKSMYLTEINNINTRSRCYSKKTICLRSRSVIKIFIPTILSLIINQTAYAQNEHFRFGISAPLTGVLAEYGVAITNGIELAKLDYPEEFKQIDLFIEDSKWDPKTAVDNFNWLKNVKKTQLIYNWGNPTSEAVAPLAERAKLPLLTMSSDHQIAKNREYVIRTLVSADDLGKLLAEQIKKSSYKNLGVIICENSYVDGLLSGLTSSLKESEINFEVFGNHLSSDQDFKISIAKAKSKNYDAIIVFLISGQIRTFFRQMEDFNLKLPTFGADFFSSQSEIDASGKLIDGAIFPDLAVTPEFTKRYIDLYKNNVQISFAANAYDVASTVALNFGNISADKLSNHEILNKLKSGLVSNYGHGGFKLVHQPEYGYYYKTNIRLRKISNGKIVNLGKE